MQIIDRFTLVDSHRKKDGKMLISKQGEPLSIDVEGLIIKSQFELSNSSYLVWLTDDSPFDEMLHIYLISPNGIIEDAVEAGSRWGLGPGGVLQIEKIEDDWIDFNFFSDDTTYRLEISLLEKRFLGLPYCWRYKNFLQKHVIRIIELDKENEQCKTSP